MTQLDHSTRPTQTVRVPASPADLGSGIASPPPVDLDAGIAARSPKGRHSWWRLVVLGLAAVADVALAVPAFDGVLRGWTGTSVGCAIAFVIVTVWASYTSGHELKLQRRALAIVAASATMALIGAVFFLRILAASLQASALYSGAAGSTTATADETPIAIVMAALMLATSAMAWIDGYISTPRHAETQSRDLHNELHKAETEHGTAQGVVTRLNEDLDMAEYQLARIDIDLRDALHALDAVTGELQDLARTELVRHLGNYSRELDYELTKAETEQGSAQGVVTRLNEDLDMAEYQLARIDIDLRDALHGLDAVTRELQELSRTEIARHLGNPAASSDLDRPLS